MTRTRKRPEELRSQRWFGVKDLRSFGHRSRALQMGYAREDFAGKPVIGFINTWSEINSCHYHFKQRVEEVERGVWLAAGIPEWGRLPIPQKPLKRGVRDMLRISDARMSGTSYGACVLHAAPESYTGGPLDFVRDGDLIEIDVEGRRLQLLGDDAGLARRRAGWKVPAPRFARGFGALYSRDATQADKGCDFDFLEGAAPTPEPDIH